MRNGGLVAIVCLGCRSIRYTQVDQHQRLSPGPCSCGEPGWTTLADADRDRAGVEACARRRGGVT